MSIRACDEWGNDFAHAFETMMGAHTISIQTNSPFFGTELIIFKNTYKGQLPLNGVKEDEYKTRVKIYQLVCGQKTVIQILGAKHYKKEVKNSFKFLFLRSTTFRLIEHIINNPSKEKIFVQNHDGESSGEVTYKDDGTYIAYAKRTYDYITLLPTGKKGRLKYHFPIVLAHEFIHVAEALNPPKKVDFSQSQLSIRFDEPDNKKKNTFVEKINFPLLPFTTKFDDEYEQETITGWKDQCYSHFNENAIRASFNLLPRINHRSICAKPADAKWKGDLLPSEILFYLRDCAGAGLSDEIDAFFIANPELKIASICDNGHPLLQALADIAIHSHEVDVFAVLVKWGLNLAYIPHDSKNVGGWNLMQWIVIKRAGKILDFCLSQLKDKIAKYMVVDPKGETLLHLAMMDSIESAEDPFSRLDIIKALVKWGVKVNDINGLNETPFHAAVRLDLEEVVLYLGGITANLNTKNKKGETPLLTAAKSSSASVLRALLGLKGIDRKVKDAQGQNALQLLKANPMDKAVKKPLRKQFN